MMIGRWSLIKSPFLWLISVFYLVVFSLKTACENWAQLFIVHDLNMTDFAGDIKAVVISNRHISLCLYVIQDSSALKGVHIVCFIAVSFLSAFEAGGFISSFITGYLTDISVVNQVLIL